MSDINGENVILMQPNRVKLMEWRYEMLARAECHRVGIAPDEIIDDMGHPAWMQVGHEAATKEAALNRKLLPQKGTPP
jgi:hypothetical protein